MLPISLFAWVEDESQRIKKSFPSVSFRIAAHISDHQGNGGQNAGACRGKDAPKEDTEIGKKWVFGKRLREMIKKSFHRLFTPLESPAVAVGMMFLFHRKWG